MARRHGGHGGRENLFLGLMKHSPCSNSTNGYNNDSGPPEVLKSYVGLGEAVQLDEGARSSIVLKLIPADDEAP